MSNEKLQDPNWPFPHEIVHCRNCHDLIRVKTKFDTRGTVVRNKKDAKWSWYGGLVCSKHCEEESVINHEVTMPGHGKRSTISHWIQKDINERWDN